MKPTVAVLHPGQMGAAMARAAGRNAERVLWCSAGRSAATAERAGAAGLTAVETLAEALEADIVLSICPPASAEGVATEVAEAGFTGLYVDCNAISPQRAEKIADRLAKGGARPVDGGIVGPPPRDGRRNRLYLSGPATDLPAVAGLFAGGPVE